MSQIVFGTDGWRGVIAEDFTDENVRKVTQAIARYVVRCEQPEKGVLVGYDTRYGSERFARIAADTIAATGTPVWLADSFCPTPAISLLVRLRGAAGGVMITASHNPYKWNGVKYKASYGSSASPAIVAQIEKELAHVQANGFPRLPARRIWRPWKSWWIGSGCAARNSASAWIPCTERRKGCCGKSSPSTASRAMKSAARATRSLAA